MLVFASLPLDHLDRMSDSTGLIQHAIYSLPRRESGYTTDDNARALRLCTRLWSQHSDERMLDRVRRYLSFVEFAHCSGRGFHNFLSYQRHWLDAEGTGDCQGQAVRALAEVLGSGLPEDLRLLSRELIDAALPTLGDLRSLRAQAYVILAWEILWKAGVKEIEPLESVAWSAARRLVECYFRSLRPDWQWFESKLTYANAVLPQALFAAARRWPDADFGEVAEASFAFLDRATTVRSDLQPEGSAEASIFWPIGNEGWHPHGEEKASYDQQPIEACTMAEAALAAYALLGGHRYLSIFYRAHSWFQGNNSLWQPLIEAGSGACCDGLQPHGVNRNQGAESTLAWLWTDLLHGELQQALGADGSERAATA